MGTFKQTLVANEGACGSMNYAIEREEGFVSADPDGIARNAIGIIYATQPATKVTAEVSEKNPEKCPEISHGKKLRTFIRKELHGSALVH